MGSIVLNPPSVPNTEVDSWAPLVVRDAMSYYGLNRVSITNWDLSPTVPQIAQGSLIDIDGSLAEFISDESISGAPADGVVYVKFVVVGDVVTPTWDVVAPEWDGTKGGWYNVAGERYSGHYMNKAGTDYTGKAYFQNNQAGRMNIIEDDLFTFTDAVPGFTTGSHVFTFSRNVSAVVSATCSAAGTRPEEGASIQINAVTISGNTVTVGYRTNVGSSSTLYCSLFISAMLV